ncbi:MAG: regulatory iron-sulfur-containing complex subunit RicT [Smithellaceae bacterium]|nr:regulatory iron-sulfur-containing complex subunit RicT [Smithellaceae bacterium]
MDKDYSDNLAEANNYSPLQTVAGCVCPCQTTVVEATPPRNLIGIKFRPEGKTYTFLAGDHELKKDELVLVDTENGLSMGKVVTETFSLSPGKMPPNLKPVVRIASDEDLKTQASNKKLEDDAAALFKEKVRLRGLPMKLVDVDCLFDRSKLLFYFSSESRVDFRELVKDLVQKYRIKIELRQIGARHEARIIKGMGICGREVCCAVLHRNNDRVSVKMAKEQNMSLNPEKISGLCGRLMCCLGYEYETYVELKRTMPKCNKIVNTPQGRGKVVRQNILTGEATVQLEDGKDVIVSFKDIAIAGPCCGREG